MNDDNMNNDKLLAFPIEYLSDTLFEKIRSSYNIAGVDGSINGACGLVLITRKDHIEEIEQLVSMFTEPYHVVQITRGPEKFSVKYKNFEYYFAWPGPDDETYAEISDDVLSFSIDAETLRQRL